MATRAPSVSSADFRRAVQAVSSCTELNQAERTQALASISKNPLEAVVVASLPATHVAQYIRSIMPAQAPEKSPEAELLELVKQLPEVGTTKKKALRQAKQIAAQSVVSEQELASIRAAFERFDRDKSGGIDANELRLLSLELGVEMTEAECEEALRDLDSDKSGVIEFEEFLDWWTAKQEEKPGALAKLMLLKLRLHSDFLKQGFGSVYDCILHPEMSLPPTADPNESRISGSQETSFGSWSEPARMSVKFGFHALSEKEFQQKFEQTSVPNETVLRVTFSLAVRDGANDAELEHFRDLLKPLAVRFPLVQPTMMMFASLGLPFPSSAEQCLSLQVFSTNVHTEEGHRVLSVTAGLNLPPGLAPQIGDLFTALKSDEDTFMWQVEFARSLEDIFVTGFKNGGSGAKISDLMTRFKASWCIKQRVLVAINQFAKALVLPAVMGGMEMFLSLPPGAVELPPQLANMHPVGHQVNAGLTMLSHMAGPNAMMIRGLAQQFFGGDEDLLPPLPKIHYEYKAEYSEFADLFEDRFKIPEALGFGVFDSPFNPAHIKVLIHLVMSLLADVDNRREEGRFPSLAKILIDTFLPPDLASTLGVAEGRFPEEFVDMAQAFGLHLTGFSRIKSLFLPLLHFKNLFAGPRELSFTVGPFVTASGGMGGSELFLRFQNFDPLVLLPSSLSCITPPTVTTIEEYYRYVIDNVIDAPVNSATPWSPPCNTSAELLEAAAIGHDGAVLRCLHNRVDPNSRDGSGRTALHLACRGGHDGCVRNLLENGADVHATDALGNTPLHCVGPNRVMVSKGPSLGQVINQDVGIAYAMGLYASGQTLMAARNGPPDCGGYVGDIVEQLLAAGARPNATNAAGQTPLHTLCCSAPIAALLNCSGGDLNVNARDSCGQTPLLATFANSKPFSAPFLAIPKNLIPESKIGLLIRHDADVNAKDSQGRTALHYLVMNQQAWASNFFCTYLLGVGADPTITDNSGLSPNDMDAGYIQNARGEEWTCSTCQYKQTSLRGVCQMCGTAEAPEPVERIALLSDSADDVGGPALAAPTGAPWTCPSCTYENSASQAVCEMCEGAKPE